MLTGPSKVWFLMTDMDKLNEMRSSALDNRCILGQLSIVLLFYVSCAPYATVYAEETTPLEWNAWIRVLFDVNITTRSVIRTMYKRYMWDQDCCKACLAESVNVCAGVDNGDKCYFISIENECSSGLQLIPSRTYAHARRKDMRCPDTTTSRNTTDVKTTVDPFVLGFQVFSSTSIANGTAQSSIETINACLEWCLAKVDCAGFDWSDTGSRKCVTFNNVTECQPVVVKSYSLHYRKLGACVSVKENQFYGCYTDNPACAATDVNCRLMTSYVTLLTPPQELIKCSDTCRMQNSIFFGKTKNGFCLCGDVPNVFGEANRMSCNQQCVDDQRYGSMFPQYTCGGTGVVSVYYTCPLGWFGKFQCDQRCHCADNNPCSPVTGICFNIHRCADGWITSDSTGLIPDLHCNRRNCSEFNGNCYTDCLVNPGEESMSCRCLPGFHMSSNGYRCEDDDECAMYPLSNCTHPRCRNNVGSFVCGCDDGFEHRHESLNGSFFCWDVDECSDAYLPRVCERNITTCVNTPGSYHCDCKNGFVDVPSSHSCIDVDECAAMNTSCHICINLPGSYHCRCFPGYTLIDVSSCVDMDECQTNGACDPATTVACINTPGSYECTCKAGYIRVSSTVTCSEYNMCEGIPNPCLDIYSTGCIHTVGQYRCICRNGFENINDIGPCVAIDQCAPGRVAEKCHEHGICDGVNPFGSFTCTCYPGYRLNALRTACDHIQTTCEPPCITGYTCNSATFECEEINECLFDPIKTSCHNCTNSVGGYTCKCRSGYRVINNLYCEEVDECTERTGLACTASGGICYGHSPPGGFTCTCKEGFNLQVPSTCVEYNPCTNVSLVASTCVRPQSTTGCVHGPPGTFKCICNPGYDSSFKLPICLDIDECLLGSCNIPHAKTELNGSNCINNPGSFICLCEEGYQFKSLRCDAIKYCDEMTNPCGDPVRVLSCTNLNVFYKCECKHPYIPDASKRQCIRPTTCVPPCTFSNVCNITDPNPISECRRGYVCDDVTLTCEDINECLGYVGRTCAHSGVCNGTYPRGSFTCSCLSGYQLNVDGTSCIDIDECLPNPCLVPSAAVSCSNTAGGYFCVCQPGFEFVNRVNCTDIDECAGRPCSNWTSTGCINEIGNYKCTCKPGFRNVGSICQDIDDCLEGVGLNCKATGGLCDGYSPPGSFTCTCPKGFNLAALSKCVDYDPCTNVTLVTSTCVNPQSTTGCVHGPPGTFKCVCNPGYESSFQFPSCEDIDECGRDVCNIAHVETYSNGTNCMNKPGSFICLCEEGYKFVSPRCDAIKYCDEMLNPCGDPVGVLQCINLNVFYKCECKHPYMPDASERQCIPIKYCDEMSNQCGDPVGVLRCTNLDVFYKCECKHPYMLDASERQCILQTSCIPPCVFINICNQNDRDTLPDCRSGYACNESTLTCEDIDECLGYVGRTCDYTGFCNGTFPRGSFTCSCLSGYQLNVNGTSCIDIDECGLNPCGVPGTAVSCNNTAGGYFCLCQPGFEFVNRVSCTDIDECAGNPCSSWTSTGCENEIGGYKCTCKPGFRNVGSTCQEIDDCLEGIGLNCNATGGICDGYSPPGDFTCTCPKGFNLEAMSKCVDYDPCSNVSLITSTCVSPQSTPGCVHGPPGTYKCVCSPGYNSSFDLPSCLDIDECAGDICNIPHAEHGPNSTNCVNTPGAYICHCEVGYKFNTPHCEAIKYCDEMTNPCGDPIRVLNCINLDVFYKCECKHPYMPDESARQCIKQTTCIPQCSFINVCNGTDLDPIPDCRSGYACDDTTFVCVDIDECLGYVGQTCNHTGVCAGTFPPGSFTCSCLSGYHLNQAGTGCIDIDECTSNPCDVPRAAVSCNNTAGGYYCICQPGHEFVNNVTCTDINECTNDPCSNWTSTGCVNTAGGYNCTCKAGFVNVGSMCQATDKCAPGNIAEKCSLGGLGVCDGFNPLGSFTCTCNIGFTLNTRNITCQPTDYCSSPHVHCHFCINTIGTYMCSCRPSFQLVNNSVCEVINQCELLRNSCHSCIMNGESWVCSCSSGYKVINNMYCEEIDYCNDTTIGATCNQHGVCIPKVPQGSYTCLCNPGFKLAPDRMTCEDTDECNLMTCTDCCMNTFGSFYCLPGYKLFNVTECKACKPMGVTVSGGSNDVGSPVSYYRSSSAIFIAHVFTECSRAGDSVRALCKPTWYALPLTGRMRSSITLPSNTMFLGLPPRFLPYSVYNVTVQVEIDQLTLTGFTYIEIKRTPLIAVLEGGDSVAHDVTEDIIVSAAASRDPDVAIGEKTLSYTWYCTTTDQQVPLNDPTAEVTPSACFKDMKVKLPFASEKARLTVEQIIEPVIGKLLVFQLYIAVIGEPNRGSSYTRQDMTIVSDPILNVHIDCVVNCNGPMNPSYRFVLRAFCKVCKSLSFTWVFISPSPSNSVILIREQDTLTGMRNAVLNINHHVFESIVPETYYFELNVYNNISFYVKNSYKFVTSGVPKPGVCMTVPPTGYALSTFFSVSCEGFTDPNLPLSYTFVVAQCSSGPVKELNRGASIVYNGPDSRVFNILLPVGDATDSYYICIFVSVANAYFAQARTASRIQVRPNFTSETLPNVNRHLESLKNGNNPIATAQSIYSLTKTLNDPSIQAVVSLTDRQKVRLDMLMMLADMSNSAPSGSPPGYILPVALLQQAISALQKITAVSSEVNIADVISKIDLIKLVANIQSSVEGMSPEVKNAVLFDIYNTLLLAISDLLAVIQSAATPATDEKTKLAVTQMMTVIDLVTSILSDFTYLGEFKRIENTQLTSSVRTYEPSSSRPTILSHTNDNESSSSAVILSEEVFSFLKPGESDVFSAKMTTFSQNPYVFGENSHRIKGEVLQVNVTYDGLPIDPSNLEKGFSIALCTGDSFNTIEYSKVVLTPTSKYALVVFDRTVPDSMVLIHLYINVKNPPSVVGSDDKQLNDDYYHNKFVGSVNLSLYFGEKETLASEMWKNSSKLFRSLWQYSFSKASKQLPTKRVGIPQDALTTAQIQILMVYNTTPPANVEVGYHVSEVYLMQYDRKTNAWKSDGCRVNSELTRASHTVGSCGGHMGMYSRGFLVMPNTLHFMDDIAKFAEFWKNPVGIIAVIVVFLIYFLLLVWALRQDNLDTLMALPVDLADNVDNARYVYFVSVITGSRRGSGTSSMVYLCLLGTLGTSAAHRLSCRLFPVLQRTHVNIFVIRTVASIGEIVAVRVWHYNMGKSPRWFVSRIIVHDWPASKKHYFMCKSWLSADFGGSLDRTFTAASEIESTSFHNLVMINALSGISDKYIWFSICARPPLSNFTRVQRLSCCLTLLLSYLFANVLFYGIVPDHPEDRYILGPVSFSWAKLAIAIESVLVMLPLNLIIVELFRSARRRPRERKLIKDLDIVPEVHSPPDQVLPPPIGQRMLDSSSLKSFSQDSFVAENIIGGQSLAPEYMLEPKPDTATSPYDKVGPTHSGTVAATLGNDVIPTGNFSSNAAVDPSVSKTSVANTETDVSRPASSVGTVKVLSDFRTAIDDDGTTIQHGLPWWVIIIAWTLVILIAVSFSFLIILYTFEFGLDKSLSWIQSVSCSFFIGTFLEQPLKIFVVALILALIFKKSDDIEFNKTDIIADQSVRILDVTNVPRWNFIHRMRSHPHYKPPGRAYLTSMQSSFGAEAEFYGLLLDLFIYAIFIALILAVVNIRRDISVFERNESFRKRLFDNDYYRAVTTRGDFWVWTICAWLETIFETSYNVVFEPSDNVMGYLYQPARVMRFMSIQKSTVPYVVRYQYHNNVSVSGSTLFQYDSETNRKNLLAMLHTGWFNKRFSAVILEYCVYTSYSDLITQVITVAEMPTTGGVFISHEIRSFRLHQYEDSLQQAAFLVEASFFIFTTVFFFYVMYKVVTLGHVYFGRFMSVIDLCLLVSSVTFIASYAIFNVKLHFYKKHLNEFPFQQLSDLDTAILCSLGLISLSGIVKVINVLRYSPAIAELLDVLSRAFRYFSSYFVYWFILLLALSTFINLMFGVYVYDFSSISLSLRSLLMSIVRVYSYERLDEIMPAWAPIIYAAVLAMFLISLQGLALAVLCAIYTEFNQLHRSPGENQLFGRFAEQLRSFLGRSSRTKDAQKTSVEQKAHKNEDMVLPSADITSESPSSAPPPSVSPPPGPPITVAILTPAVPESQLANPVSTKQKHHVMPRL